MQLILLVFVVLAAATGSGICEVHYNIPDPECTGPFGVCTNEDKDRLGYAAIKKLHAKMDEDSDGQVELQETKEFMQEELMYKSETYNERQEKFHGSDQLISVEEMWKSWHHSAVYNWTSEDVVVWLQEQVKLPQYADYFRRNFIDGQFLPRLALNENNYYSNVMQIKDPRHKRLLIIKSTDLVLFGQQQKPYNVVKDALMIGALTLSIVICIYLYSKHRQSLEQIRLMLAEFDNLQTTTDSAAVRLTEDKSSFFLFGRKSLQPTSLSMNSEKSQGNLLLFAHQKESQLINEKNQMLVKELTHAKKEADSLRKARESANGQIVQLKLAEQELEKVRSALRQTEKRLEAVKYQPPETLIALLNRTCESEKELLDYKFKLVDKEREICVDSLNKVCKRQSGILSALKIAHSSTLDEIQHKLELLKRELNKLKGEKMELNKRWSAIFDLCTSSSNNNNNNNNNNNARNDINSTDSGSQDLPFVSLESGLLLPRKIWTASGEAGRCSPSLHRQSHSAGLIRQLLAESLLRFSGVEEDEPLLPSQSIEFPHSMDAFESAEENAELHSEKRAEQPTSTRTSTPTTQPDELRRSLTVPAISIDLVSSTQSASTDLVDAINSNINTIESPEKVDFALNDNKTDFEANNNNTLAINLNHESSPLSPNGVKLVVEGSGGGKIARDSLIHKPDVFQFDDVESVQTNDFFYRHSSFESDDTCRSSPHLPAVADKKPSPRAYLMPFLRASNSSSLKKKEKSKRPLSSSGSSKLKKSVTTNAIENHQTAPTQGSSSLQRSGTFSKHFSSLRRLLHSSKHASADPLPADHKASVSSIPATSTTSKQLTISVKPANIGQHQSTGDLVSIPLSAHSNNSFTITSGDAEGKDAKKPSKRFPLRFTRKLGN